MWTDLRMAYGQAAKGDCNHGKKVLKPEEKCFSTSTSILFLLRTSQK